MFLIGGISEISEQPSGIKTGLSFISLGIAMGGNLKKGQPQLFQLYCFALHNSELIAMAGITVSIETES
jgi:hypothetical protein